MRYAEADEKGKEVKNVKLGPRHQDKIYTDATDDEKSVRIVAGTVVRIKEPSPRMYEALTRIVYGPDRENLGTLLVETDEAPNFWPEQIDAQFVMPANRTAEQEHADLAQLAKKLGFSLTPVEGNAAPTNEAAVLPDEAPVESLKDNGDGKSQGQGDSKAAGNKK